jgi:hypothetical protein
MKPGASGDTDPDSVTTEAPAGSAEHEQGSGLAGCGPEFLLLEIEIMRLEGIVSQVPEPEANETRG